MIRLLSENVPVGNLSMGGYLVQPAVGMRGAVVLIQEIFGVTPAMRAIADDFAASGLAVLVPDIYWRLQPDLDLGNGEDPLLRDRAVDYSLRLDESLATSDLATAIDWLAKTTGKRPGVMGFCLGGRLAVRVAAAASPSCMVSMYGVKVDTLKQEIENTACPMQFHYGDRDNHNPIPVIETVRTWVDGLGRQTDEFFVYPGAEHAFYNRFRLDRFNEKAHSLARDRVLAFLQSHLR